jgi:hypothetical protein
VCYCITKWLVEVPIDVADHRAREHMALFLLRALAPDDERPRIMCLRFASRICLATMEDRLQTDLAFRSAVHEQQLLHAQEVCDLDIA